jgi:phosphopantothenate-cysteine ligase
MDTGRIHRIIQGNVLSPPTHPTHHPHQLETDPSILIPKARASLERYGHQLVIGNLLHTRKYEVVLVSRKELVDDGTERDSGNLTDRGRGEEVDADGNGNGNENADGDGLRLERNRSEDGQFVQSWLRLREGRTEIEEDLISQLVKYHEAWISRQEKKKTTS